MSLISEEVQGLPPSAPSSSSSSSSLPLASHPASAPLTWICPIDGGRQLNSQAFHLALNTLLLHPPPHFSALLPSSLSPSLSLTPSSLHRDHWPETTWGIKVEDCLGGLLGSKCELSAVVDLSCSPPPNWPRPLNSPPPPHFQELTGSNGRGREDRWRKRKTVLICQHPACHRSHPRFKPCKKHADKRQLHRGATVRWLMCLKYDLFLLKPKVLSFTISHVICFQSMIRDATPCFVICHPTTFYITELFGDWHWLELPSNHKSFWFWFKPNSYLCLTTSESESAFRHLFFEKFQEEWGSRILFYNCFCVLQTPPGKEVEIDF